MQEEQKNPLVDALHHILKFYYGNVERETILTLAGVDDESFSRDNLFVVVKESNLVSNKEHTQADNLDNFLLPVIIKYGNDYLVLEGYNKDKAIVFNPKTAAKEEIKRSKLKAKREVLFFFRNERDVTLSSRSKTLDWFYAPLKASWRSYLEVGLISFFINIFALALPLFTMSVYDRVIPNFALETLYVLATGVGIIFIFEM